LFYFVFLHNRQTSIYHERKFSEKKRHLAGGGFLKMARVTQCTEHFDGKFSQLKNKKKFWEINT